MTWAQNLGHADQNRPSSPRFVEASEIGNVLQEAEKAGLMPVLVPPPGPGQRGRLALVIEGAVEEVLSRRGGSPPGVGASSDLDTSLSDQVYRARLVGYSGLALGFPSLEGIANLAGSVDAEDSAVLRWWIAATQERPIRLYLAKRDRFLGVYGPPVSLLSVASATVQPEEHEAPTAVPEVAASVAAMELSSAPPNVESADDDLGEPQDDGAAGPTRTPGDAGEAPIDERTDDPAAEVPASTSSTAAAMAKLFVEDNEPSPPTEPLAAPVPPGPPTAPQTDDPDGTSNPLGPAQQSFEQVLEELLRDVAAPASPDAPPDRCVDVEAECDSDDAPSDQSSMSGEAASEVAASSEASEVAASSEASEVAASSEASEVAASDDAAKGNDAAANENAAASDDASANDDASASADPSPGKLANDTTNVGTTARAAFSADQISSIEAPAPAHPTSESNESQEAAIASLHPDAATQWPTWVEELDAARGPKPLGVVERMFVSAYAPLQDALALGIADEQAARTLETWGASFEKSYTDAFDALRLRGKRPTMVLDVPDIAHRLARLHGARAVQLLLVDGMRYDVGQRMHEHLRPRLEQRAALTERLLLWSALPTTTTTQLELIGGGPEGLRDMGRSADAHQPVARGRAAALPRRIKAGHREVMKLDLVEARIAQPEQLTPAALDAVAKVAAESIAAHFGRLRERTLAVVFGDHGFRIHDGDGMAQQGGARPEEVLVPAYAWLVGRVH